MRMAIMETVMKPSTAMKTAVRRAELKGETGLERIDNVSGMWSGLIV